MKIHIVLIVTVLLLAMGTVEARPLAKVNGVEITDEMFNAFAASRIRKPVTDLSAEERETLTEELIKLVVIGSEARRQKVQADPVIAAQMQLQELSFLAQAYLQQHLQQNPVAEEKLQALYDAKYGSRPMTEYKARHILVNSPTLAQQIIGELDAGADFVEMAAKHSTGPSAKSGGDLGWFTHQQMVPEFADAVVKMTDGSHSDAPVQTQYGWHVILREAEREGPPPQLAAVGQELERELQQQEIQSLVDNLRDTAKVRTYQ